MTTKKKTKAKTPIIVALDVALLRGLPDLKILLYLTLYGPSTVDELIASKVLGLSDGNIRSAISHAVARGIIIKQTPKPEDRKILRGAKPHRFAVSGHGVKYLQEYGVQYPKKPIY
jgi:hypothetical protein